MAPWSADQVVGTAPTNDSFRQRLNGVASHAVQSVEERTIQIYECDAETNNLNMHTRGRAVFACALHFSTPTSRQCFHPSTCQPQNRHKHTTVNLRAVRTVLAAKSTRKSAVFAFSRSDKVFHSEGLLIRHP
eukprot:3791428-Pleurochrysis_carterae.AAC.1